MVGLNDATETDLLPVALTMHWGPTTLPATSIARHALGPGGLALTLAFLKHVTTVLVSIAETEIDAGGVVYSPSTNIKASPTLKVCATPPAQDMRSAICRR